MQNENSFLENLGETIGYLKHHIEKQVELYRLSITEIVIRTLSGLITGFLILSVVAMFILFISLATAYFLASWLGSSGLAFLIVALFYALVAVFLFAFRRPLIRQPILEVILQNFKEEEAAAEAAAAEEEALVEEEILEVKAEENR